MPTYEYGCPDCGSEWEEVQRITAPPIEVCPKCGKSSAHRLISAGGGFILKGGGWYSDLYSSAKPASNKVDTNGTTSTDADSKAANSGDKAAAATSEKSADAGSSTAATPAATTPSTPASST